MINHILNINNLAEETVINYPNNNETNIQLEADSDIPKISFFESNFIIKKKGKKIHINFTINCVYTQNCGVSLDEVSQKINISSTRNYVISKNTTSNKQNQKELDLSYMVEEDIEYLSKDDLDLYAIFLEEFILNIDYNFKKDNIDIIEYSNNLNLHNNIKLYKE